TVQVATPNPCDAARAERGRIEGLLNEGKLDRTLRVIARARKLCPDAYTVSRVEAETLAAVGRYDEASVFAEAVAAAPSASDEDRTAAAKIEAGARVLGATLPATDEAKRPMREAYGKAATAALAGDNAAAKKLFLDAWTAWHPNGQALVGAA